MAILSALTFFSSLTIQENISILKTKAAHNYEITTKRTLSRSSRTDEYDPQSIHVNVPDARQSQLLTKSLVSHVTSGDMDNAVSLFESMCKSDTFVWNVLIRGLTDHGFFEEAVDFYYRMCFSGVRADNFTFPFVIKACGELCDLREGEKVHAMVCKVGLKFDLYVCNALICMYAKLGFIESSERVFSEMQSRDLVSWNSMINAYAIVGDGWSSLLCIKKMQSIGLKHDKFTVIGSIKACSLVCSLIIGKEIHGQVIKSTFGLDVVVQTSLIDMYGKCGLVQYAQNLFEMIPQRSIITWNAMIGCYALNLRPLESFTCFRKMQASGDLHPDNITLINLLPSCAQVGALLPVKSIHGFAIRKEFLPHLVLETTLIDMYGKLQELRLAKQIFDQMSLKNLISWNAIVAAYVRNGQSRQALKLFSDLIYNHSKPDASTISSILPAYSDIASLTGGKQIHSYIIKLKFSANNFVTNSIIYMYARCGDLPTAQQIFDRMCNKDIISWNTMIMAYGIHGYGAESLKLFSEMRNNIKPNASTFVSILSSCSIAGLDEEGWKYFHLMKREYGIDPQIEHYGSMLDLLGRKGDLEHAKKFIHEMPLPPTARIWGSLLAASRHHRNIELAEVASYHILSLAHDNTGCYIVLSNMYAEVGRWEDVERIKDLMSEEGLAKTIGCSDIEINYKTIRFVNHDRSHLETDTIYDVLAILLRQIGEELFVSLSKFKPVDQIRTRLNSPKCHSVRLAISYGLISMSIGKPLVIKKNVRICSDCHDVAKKISDITNREIVFGDSKIFHHFKDGQCSCRDYW